MKKAAMITVVLMALACALVPAARAGDVPQRISLPGEKQTYELVWHDEFEGNDYDRTKWECPVSFRQDASLWHPENLTITGGVARFDIRYNPDWKIRYQSAALRTQKRYDGRDLFTFTYGYVEARCKLPCETNCNYWAAFWLLSTHNDGKSTDTRDGLEVDIFETFVRGRRDNRNVAAFHWGGYGENHNSCGIPYRRGAPDPYADNDWHVFGLLWTEKEYVVYLDGVEVVRTDLMGAVDPNRKDSTPSRGPLRRPSLIKLSCEAAKWASPSGRWVENPPLHDRFEVDYVRVYQAKIP